MNYIKHLIILIIIFGSYSKSIAQFEKDTLRVLFVGNSYTSISNMPHLVSLISDSTKVKLITTKSTAGGATLSDHWNGEKELKTKDVICSGLFDIVVIQAHSLETIENKENFFKYSKLLCDLAKESGAKPYLYVTWSRQKYQHIQDKITKVYIEVAKVNECDLVLVGEAWKLARTIRPDILLYMSDGSHQNDLGAFLNACQFVGKFTGEVPANLNTSYRIKDAKGEEIMLFWEDALDVELCQKVASEFFINVK
ncbi:MAG: hypothetical protein R2863_07835 [Candidatus Kapaibacterium sp.]|nr:hypothetical protein [Ignavibacteriota bacterium]MCB9220518.1 hypothetical protein [Ignavibacteria bacterium]